MKLIISSPFAALVSEKEVRQINGLLSNPPRLFVLWYSDYHGEIRCTSVDWDVAQVLAPKEMASMCEAIQAHRRGHWPVSIKDEASDWKDGFGPRAPKVDEK